MELSLSLFNQTSGPSSGGGGGGIPTSTRALYLASALSNAAGDVKEYVSSGVTALRVGSDQVEVNPGGASAFPAFLITSYNNNSVLGVYSDNLGGNFDRRMDFHDATSIVNCPTIDAITTVTNMLAPLSSGAFLQVGDTATQANLQVGTDDFTLNLGLTEINTTPLLQYVVAKMDGTGKGYRVRFAGDSLMLELNDGTNSVDVELGTNIVPNGTFNFTIVVSRTEGKAKLYLGSTLMDSKSISVVTGSLDNTVFLSLYDTSLTSGSGYTGGISQFILLNYAADTSITEQPSLNTVILDWLNTNPQNIPFMLNTTGLNTPNSEILAEPSFTTHTKWSVTGGWDASFPTGTAKYTVGVDVVSGLTQAYADMASHFASSNVLFKLKYDVLNYTAPDNPINVYYINNPEKIFPISGNGSYSSMHISEPGLAEFTINVDKQTATSGSFSIDNLALKQVGAMVAYLSNGLSLDSWVDMSGQNTTATFTNIDTPTRGYPIQVAPGKWFVDGTEVVSTAPDINMSHITTVGVAEAGKVITLTSDKHVNMNGAFLSGGKMNWQPPTEFISFNGINNYIDIDYSSAIDVGFGNFAIEVTFRCNDVSLAEQHIINKLTGGVGWRLYLKTNQLWFEVGDGTSYYGGSFSSAIIPTIEDDTVYHALITVNTRANLVTSTGWSSGATLFLDGAFAGFSAFALSSPWTIDVSSGGRIRIGSESGGTTMPFNGDLFVLKILEGNIANIGTAVADASPVTSKFANIFANNDSTPSGLQSATFTEVLSETAFATYTKWHVTGDLDAAFTGNKVNYLWTADQTSTLSQLKGDFASALEANAWYSFRYTMDATVSSDGTLDIYISNAIATATTYLVAPVTSGFDTSGNTPKSDKGAYEVLFKTNSIPGDFEIKFVSSGCSQGTLSFDNFSLHRAGVVYDLSPDGMGTGMVHDVHGATSTISGATISNLRTLVKDKVYIDPSTTGGYGDEPLHIGNVPIYATGGTLILNTVWQLSTTYFGKSGTGRVALTSASPNATTANVRPYYSINSGLGGAPASGYLSLVSTGVEAFRCNTTASAVNYLFATPSITGSAVTLGAEGTDIDIDLSLTPKGAGVTNINSHVLLDPTQTGTSSSPSLMIGKTTLGFWTSGDSIYTAMPVNSLLASQYSASWGLRNANTTGGNVPTLIPNRGDQNSGVGSNGTSMPTMVAGSVEAMRWQKDKEGATGPTTFVPNLTIAPSTNPTGGGVLYCEAGALKYRGTSGTVTTIASA